MENVYRNLLSRYLHVLAKIYIVLNRPLKALACLENALQASPEKQAIYFTLARVNQILGNWDNLIISLERALDFNPNDLSIHWRIGILALDVRHNDKALEHLLYCYNKTPKDNKILLARRQALLGASLILAKDWIDAEKHLTEARLLVPWDLDAFSATVQLYLCNKRSKDILELIDDYIREYPSLYPPYSWKGDHFQYVLREPKNSLEYYRLALEKILYKEARKFCNEYVFTNNMFDEILDRYVEALVASGNSSAVLTEIHHYENYNLGTKTSSNRRKILYYTLTGKFDEAEKFLTSLDVKYKESAEFLSSVAFLKNKEGNFSEAIELIENAIRNEKDYIEAYDVLGEIQINSRQWQSALVTYTYLSNRDFYTAFQMKKLGLCHFHLGDLEKAIDFYNECLLRDEFDAESWINLGDAYNNQGNKEFALSAYQNGLKFDWLDIEYRQHAEVSIKKLSQSMT